MWKNTAGNLGHGHGQQRTLSASGNIPGSSLPTGNTTSGHTGVVPPVARALDAVTIAAHDSVQPESKLVLKIANRPGLEPLVAGVLSAAQNATSAGARLHAMMDAVRATATNTYTSGADHRLHLFQHAFLAAEGDMSALMAFEFQHGNEDLSAAANGVFLDTNLSEGTAQCWEMAFLLHVALAADGVQSRVRQGHSKTAGEWHAWVEVTAADGSVFVLDPTGMPPKMMPVADYMTQMQITGDLTDEAPATPVNPGPPLGSDVLQTPRPPPVLAPPVITTPITAPVNNDGWGDWQTSNGEWTDFVDTAGPTSNDDFWNAFPVAPGAPTNDATWDPFGTGDGSGSIEWPPAPPGD